ncbi:LAFA_0G15038g1_1 [Lachancea sp. 'fantastica']|nr:LAFA_0G15038g1_1 [Lachancea sp. 'fantastica']
MSSQVVDQIFDTGFYWFKKAEKLNNRLVEKVIDLGTTTPDSKVIPFNEGSSHSSILQGLWGRPIGKVASLLGLSAAAILLWKYADNFVPRPAEHLKQDDKKCVLVFGHMRDPITRQIVMDLYRRGFVIFVCSEQGDSNNDDQGLFHVTPNELRKVIDYLHETSTFFSSILVVPNSAYNPSGAFSTLSSSVVQSELEQNVFVHMRGLAKFLPQLNHSPQIILLTPSIPLNYQIPLHSPEVFIAGLMDSFYKALTFEYPKSRVYLCHLGVLKIAGSTSNYKHMLASGSNVAKSLLGPLYELVISQSSSWFGFWERVWGTQRFYGKWSRLGYYFGNLIPLSFLKYL